MILNWTVLLKCLEMAFVVIWHITNKTELNPDSNHNPSLKKKKKESLVRI